MGEGFEANFNAFPACMGDAVYGSQFNPDAMICAGEEGKDSCTVNIQSTVL